MRPGQLTAAGGCGAGFVPALPAVLPEYRTPFVRRRRLAAAVATAFSPLLLGHDLLRSDLRCARNFQRLVEVAEDVVDVLDAD
jgi:hypothetical protein